MISSASRFQSMAAVRIPSDRPHVQSYDNNPSTRCRPATGGHELLGKLEQAGKVPSREKCETLFVH
jgi:hypothetical protein